MYVAMFGGMPEHPTGLAMSVMRRAQALAKASISTEVLIDTFYADFDGHTARLKESGRLGELISLRSLHQDLAGNSLYPSDVAYTTPLPEGERWSYVQDPKNSKVRRGYHNGEYKHFVWARGEKVNFIDHMRAGQRVRREWYDEAGTVCRIDIMNGDNKPELIRYIRRDGSTYMEDIMEPATGRVRGIVVNRENEASLFFQNSVDLFAYWMQEFVLTPAPASPVIISEYGVRRRAFERLQQENNARVIYTLHNNHLAKPNEYGGGIRADMKDFIEHIPTFDDVVVLTEEQRQDLWKHLGYQKSIHVIPHHMAPSTGIGPRDPKKVVMVGRFDEIKGQVPALSAFQMVLQVIPDARLELYGRGKDEPKIRQEIAKLGLGQSVSIAGFTEDASQVFSEAAVSIVASTYEGFCLSMAESMAAGCVPVCYSFKYGPQDLVRHGVDGMLVERGNIKDLADSISFLLLNDGQRERMSRESMTIVERISEERLIREWLQLLGTSSDAFQNSDFVTALASGL